MKRITALACAIVLLSLLCTSCQSGGELPDTYVEGSDYQYMQKESKRFAVVQAQGSKAFYFLHNGFVYFLDEETNQIMPLCNKADCLHDKETDSEKRTACNACVCPLSAPMEAASGIAYCNGFLYCVDEGDVGHPACLYRLTEDGANKDVLYTWSRGTCYMNQWVIHRDVFYYIKQFYENVGDGVKEHYHFMSLSLTDPDRQERTLFVPDEEVTVVTLSHPSAYGNYVYFSLDAFAPAEEEITNDNYLKYLYVKTYIYDIVNDQISELVLPGTSPTECIVGVNFWDDKILFVASDYALDETGTGDYYIANLDGTNQELFMEDIPKFSLFASDGEYLYLTNAHLVARGSADEEDLIYEVYNRDLELVDTFKPTTYLKFPGIYPLGTDVMYLPYTAKDGVGWGVARWDKQIGTYHGGSIDKDITKIVAD